MWTLAGKVLAGTVLAGKVLAGKVFSGKVLAIAKVQFVDYVECELCRQANIF